MDQLPFFEAVINAGAILAGFCSTFLAFRIQRESSYHRQPALDFKSGKARDIHVGLTHFTSAFLLIILASALAILFGFLVPLLGLAHVASPFITPRWVVAGMVASIILLAGYFVDELVHYQILSTRLLNDAREWRGEALILIVAGLLAVVLGYVSYTWVPYERSGR